MMWLPRTPHKVFLGEHARVWNVIPRSAAARRAEPKRLVFLVEIHAYQIAHAACENPLSRCWK